MTTGSDDALDVALGLLRAPALRGTLRARPLPEGMGELLAIASGAPERARAAAARTGFDEGELLEAARFYVQQVLLAEDADAYRVLGVERGAGHAAMRDHHRLLLRWLHPDRSEGAQWDSAFATRVNSAWTQLRSVDAVAEYDARLDAAALQAQIDMPAPAPTRRARPLGTRLESDAPPSRAGPFAVAGLGLACIALAWLAVQREGELDRRRDALMQPEAQVIVTAPPASPATAPEPQQSPAPAAQRLAPLLVVAEQMFNAAETTPAAEVEAPPDVASIEAADPRIDFALDDAPLPAPVAIASTMPAPRSVQAPAAETGAIATPRARAATPETPDRSSPRPRAPTVAHATPAAVLPAAHTSAAASISNPMPVPADPLQLMREAEATVTAVTAYLTLDDALVPAFLDAPARLEAAGVRARLHARLDARQRRDMVIQAPAWTLGEQRASLLGAYSIQARRGTRETGLLRLQLARRGDAWRIADLQLEPAQ